MTINNEIIKKIESLKDYDLYGLSSFESDLIKAINAMQSQLNSAKEVIKFYADQANWWFDEYDAKYSDIALQDIDECGFGGKKAREWLNDNK